MKNLLLMILIVAISLQAKAQNGGQYHENNAARITLISKGKVKVENLDNLCTSKKEIKGGATFDLGPLKDTIIETSETYFRLRTVSGCIKFDKGWLELITTNINLPVTFGKIDATIESGQLTINWKTLSEKNCAFFIPQISNDGNNFESLPVVKSKAIEGNSTFEIDYTASTRYSVMILFAPFFLLGFINRKMFLSVIAIALIVVACSKKDEVNIERKNVFVRVIQVDIDGNQNYSSIIKAVRQ